jgi:hypothetical protein
MALQQFFPFDPEGSDWESWNGNLIMFYGEEPIPYLPELDWGDVARSVAELPTFVNYPVPSPESYADWQSWAREFTEIINGPTK